MLDIAFHILRAIHSPSEQRRERVLCDWRLLRLKLQLTVRLQSGYGGRQGSPRLEIATFHPRHTAMATSNLMGTKS